jgi:hypothetical protein
VQPTASSRQSSSRISLSCQLRKVCNVTSRQRSASPVLLQGGRRPFAAPNSAARSCGFSASIGHRLRQARRHPARPPAEPVSPCTTASAVAGDHSEATTGLPHAMASSTQTFRPSAGRLTEGIASRSAALYQMPQSQHSGTVPAHMDALDLRPTPRAISAATHAFSSPLPTMITATTGRARQCRRFGQGAQISTSKPFLGTMRPTHNTHKVVSSASMPSSDRLKPEAATVLPCVQVFGLQGVGIHVP